MQRKVFCAIIFLFTSNHKYIQNHFKENSATAEPSGVGRAARALILNS